MQETNDWHDENKDRPASQSALVMTSLVGFAFLCLAVAGLYFAWNYRAQTNELTAQVEQTNASLAQTRSQRDELSLKMASLTATSATSAAQPAGAETTAAPATPKQGAAHRHAKRAKVEDPRWKQVQDELAEHQKAIESAQEDMDKTRGDLEGEITSSHDELNGTIARNHDELVALEKRGERDFSEFNFTKSKDFHRVGPVSIAVRKVNTKRDYADLEILVDDNRITQKHVNLLQPVMFYTSNYAQAVEVVLNHLDKNRAAGYVSVPKFKRSELSAAGAANSSTTPATGAAQPGAGLISRPAQQP
jgi:hypothetical protein